MPKIYKQFRKAENNFAVGNFLKCISILDHLLTKESDNVDFLMLRGEALLRSEEFEKALSDYARVVEKDKSNIVALINFGASLIRCNRQAEAKDVLEYVIELQPNNFDAYINLCNVYQTLNKPEQSLKTAMKAVSLNPLSAMAFNNLGTALGDLNMINDAREALITAKALEPIAINSYINLAQIEEKIGNREEAIRLYEDALNFPRITSNESDLIKYYLSYSYLYFGELEKGWKHYDFGFSPLLPVGAVRALRKFHQPKWSGESLEGKKLLVWREQGLGDEVEFSTCFFDLDALGVEVIVECESRLVDAFQRSFPRFIVRRESIGLDRFSMQNDFDLHCPVGSLPGIFRKKITAFQAQPPLFQPIAELKNKFIKRLKCYTNSTIVGISWRSGKLSVHRNDNYTVISDWKALLTQPGYQFVNLQYGDCEEELQHVEQLFGIKIHRWEDVDLKNDLESVIALCSCLDFVVSVGTAVSSIAPATGIKTYLLSHRSWIMLGLENRYPWYQCVIPVIPDKNCHIATVIERLPKLFSLKKI